MQIVPMRDLKNTMRKIEEAKVINEDIKISKSSIFQVDLEIFYWIFIDVKYGIRL